jgi:taurine transport system substrate-binding protein
MTKLTRRELGTLTSQMALATFAVGIGLAPRVALSQEVKAVLGHFSSANPQTYSKAINSMQPAFGSKAKVEYVSVNAGPQIVAAMAGDSMDICNIGSSPMVVAMANKVKLSMVYLQKVVTDSECLAVRNDTGIKDLKGLAKKKIGLPFNTSVHFALLSGLKTVGMTARDVELINMPPPSLLAAWKRKDIDAAFIWYPVLGDLVEAGGTIILKTGDLKVHGVLGFDGIIVRDAFKQKHPDLVLAYLKEYDRLCRMYREQPQEVIKVIGPFTGLTPEKAKEYVDTFHTISPKEMTTKVWMGMPGDTDTGILKTLVSQAQFLKEADQLKEVPATFAPYVDQTFLAQMAKA